jgi:hypothetical protein
MALAFKPATKKQRKLRMALMGPSGSGKTFTALTLATELAEGGAIAVIDTERGSASLYSDLFKFDSCELDHFKPENFMDAIQAAAAAGYKVLIIDSLSHAWTGEGGVLDRASAAKGNNFTDGWGKVGTPLQNKLVNAILDAPMHVIVTLRVKTEYSIEQNAQGKSVPKRIGLKAVQREGLEYEFDLIGLLSIDNALTIEKTRMAALNGLTVKNPEAKLGRQILAWLQQGAPEPQQQQQGQPRPQLQAVPTEQAKTEPGEFTVDHDDITPAQMSVEEAKWRAEAEKRAEDLCKGMGYTAERIQKAIDRLRSLPSREEVEDAMKALEHRANECERKVVIAQIEKICNDQNWNDADRIRLAGNKPLIFLTLDEANELLIDVKKKTNSKH